MTFCIRRVMNRIMSYPGRFRYYLRHLADTVRFPTWPLVDHVPLLQVGHA